MFETLLIVHIIICIALIGTILMQRSEGGGALGIGGGPGSVLSGKGAANFMTKTTSVLATIFFLTSAGLTILAGQGSKAPNSVMDQGRTKDGLPTQKIDLGSAKASNEVAAGNEVGSKIPTSSAAPSAFETSGIDAASANAAGAETANAVVNSAKDTK